MRSVRRANTQAGGLVESVEIVLLAAFARVMGYLMTALQAPSQRVGRYLVSAVQLESLRRIMAGEGATRVRAGKLVSCLQII